MLQPAPSSVAPSRRRFRASDSMAGNPQMRRAMPLLTPRSSRLATILSSGAESPLWACHTAARNPEAQSRRCAQALRSSRVGSSIENSRSKFLAFSRAGVRTISRTRAELEHAPAQMRNHRLPSKRPLELVAYYLSRALVRGSQAQGNRQAQMHLTSAHQTQKKFQQSGESDSPPTYYQ